MKNITDLGVLFILLLINLNYESIPQIPKNILYNDSHKHIK